jgi:hypothetical protein
MSATNLPGGRNDLFFSRFVFLRGVACKICFELVIVVLYTLCDLTLAAFIVMLNFQHNEHVRIPRRTPSLKTHTIMSERI